MRSLHYQKMMMRMILILVQCDLKCDLCANREFAADRKLCCMFRALSTQPDFVNQREWLQETVEDQKHMIIYFPKFHCELNFIEMVWGFMKRSLRDNCSFNFENLQLRVHDLLENTLSNKNDMIRRFHNRCLRFMDGYRKGFRGPMLEYAVKKYTSHRMFPSDLVIEEFEEEYVQHQQRKAALN